MQSIQWLQKFERFLSIKAIEQELKMPEGTLIKAVRGTRKLPNKWYEPLNEFIMSIKW